MKLQLSKFLAVVMALCLMLPTLTVRASAAESLPLLTLAAGYQHALAIMATDGTVRTWGWNAGDQLGTPHPDGVYSIASPVTVPNLSGVIAVAGGGTYSIALKSDGTVWTWGQNYEGALGNGPTVNSSTPVQVSGLTGVVSIAAGENHALALKADGTVWAWGYGYYGQLGNEKYGNGSNSNVPIQVNGLSGVAAISANNYGNHSLALTSDGKVYSWGANESGQLGLGDTTFRTLPFLVPGLSGITKIAAGQYHTLAVDAVGHVWAWGGNGGNYGNGGSASSSSPVQVPDTLLSNISDVAAGNAHSLFLKSDGTVLAAGLNDYGELGNDSTSFSAAPVSVLGLTGIVSISAGREFSLALKSDKTVWAWGWNAAKQLGIDDPATTYSGTPVPVALTGNVLWPSYATNLPTSSVCEINGTGYDDLGKAIAAVNPGDTATIKLLSDITYDKGISIAASQHLTFNLNGYNLAVITTATTGLEVSNGSVDYVGNGTFSVTGKAIGVRAVGSIASVKVTNAAATDVSSNGATAQSGGTVVVDGNATGGYIGASAAGGGSTITVGGNASGTADSTAEGANASNGGVITITGDASGVYKGAFARYDGSLITIGGNVLGTGNNSFGASADDGGVVSVSGNVQAAQYATLATNGGRVIVTGSSIATRTENGWAAYADWDGEIKIGGNAVVQPASLGVYVTIRGKVTVDGEITNGGSDKAKKYIQIANATSGSALYLTGAASERTEPSTKDGYYTYSDSISTVWVKTAEAPAPVLEWSKASGSGGAISGSISHVTTGSGIKLAAINGSGKLIISGDNGQNWSIVDTGSFVPRDVSYDGSAFIAGGNGLMKSVDGINWTNVTVSGLTNWTGYEVYALTTAQTSVGTISIANGTNGLIMATNSYDGSWMKLTTNTTANFTKKFSYVPEHSYDAGSGTYNTMQEKFAGFGGNSIYTISRIGSETTFRDVSPYSNTIVQNFSNVWYESAWNGTVITGYFYATRPNGGQTDLLISNNGRTGWDLYDTYSSLNGYAGYAESGTGTLVKVGDGGTVLTSSNGTSWSVQTVGTYDLNDIIYADGMFVAVGDHGVILTSADGLVWSVSVSNTTEDLYDIVYAGGDFIAAGNGVILQTGEAAPTPPPTITSVTVTPAAVTVQKGNTKSFSASVNGTSNPAQTVTWSVSGANKAGTTISASGILTIAADETAPTLTVTATSTVNTAKSGTATVMVTTTPPPAPTVDSVTVTPATVSVQKGNTQSFSVTVNGTNNPAQTVTWSIYGNNGGGTSINSSGLLTVAADETAATLTVTATSTADNSKSGTATVTVTAVAVTTYTVTFNSNSLVYAAKTVNAGESIGGAAWPADPTRSSYIFGGWFTGANGSGTQFTSATPVNATMTVYAKWTYSGGSGGGGGGGGGTPSTPSTPTYKADVKAGNSAGTTIPVTVDKDAGTASIDAGSKNLARGGTVITVPSIPDVDTYSVGIPVPDLSTTDVQGTLTLDTDTGSVTIPSNMLTGISGISGSKAQITIGQGDKSNLPADVKDAVGGRPLVQLTLSIAGKQTDWSNPNAPVTVSIPYKPTADELKNPESIVVWYIDGRGKAVPVPNGRYNPVTGTVTFFTTHFSHYAVVYGHKTFSDLGGAESAGTAIEAMASKGIAGGSGTTTGTNKDTFSPNTAITRADYMVWLIDTLGLTAGFTDNFDDVKPGADYYDAVGIAKKLGIAIQPGAVAGGGNNLFNPAETLSRQEMMVLAARALEKYQGLKAADHTVLEKFSDKGDIADYAQNSLAALVNAGLVEGNKLNPQSLATRAEAAVFLYAIYNKYPQAPVIPAFTLSRLAGQTAVDTALSIARAAYPDRLTNAVLATADYYPDALAGSVLAYQLDAPILLVGGSEGEQEKVIDYLKANLKAEGTVYILGGTAVVGSGMEAKIGNSGFAHITRLAGETRYDTAVKIAEQLNVKTGTPIVLVSGENYPDALAVSSIAAQNRFPILLVQKDGINDAISREIAAIKPGKIYIVGLEGAISQAVESQAARISGLGAENIVRIGGFDLYATSLAIAEYFNLGSQTVCIASGNNFPDALAGSIYAAKTKAPIILTDSSLSEQTMNYIESRKPAETAILGGEAVVGKDIERQLRQLLKP